MKLVAVEVKNACCSPGARKPVEAAPRNANEGVKSKRAASLPVTALPKSE